MSARSEHSQTDPELFALVDFQGLRQLLDASKLTSINGIVISAILTYFYWQAGTSDLVIWFAAMVIVALYRFSIVWFATKYFTCPGQNDLWKKLVVSSACASGIGWGIALPLAQINGGQEVQIVIIIVLLAVCASSVGTMFVITPALVGFIGITVAGAAFGLALSDVEGFSFIAPLTSIYIFFLLKSARTYKHIFINSEVRQQDAKRLASQLRQEKLQIEHLNRELNGEIETRRQSDEARLIAMAEAERANRAKSDFISNMSHELRTPLNGILGFGQFLQHNPREPLGEKQNQYVGYILQAGEHLLNLINQILEFSHVQSGTGVLEIVDIDPKVAIENCLSLIDASAAQRHIKIVDKTKNLNLPLVRTDQTRFKQILLNLLSNAIKYNKDGGLIVLDAQVFSRDTLRMSIADTGQGIPEYLQDKVFEPFNRLGQEISEKEGTGIGLSITRELVQALGGDIGFASKEAEGSTFWIDIPLAETFDFAVGDC